MGWQDTIQEAPLDANVPNTASWRNSIQEAPTPSFLQETKADWKDRFSNVGSDIKESRAGEINPLQAGLYGTGELAGGILDTAGNIAKRIPGYESAKNAVNSGAQAVADTIDSPATEEAAIAAGTWANEHPATIRSTNAFNNIMGALPIASVASDATKLATKGVNAAADIGAENSGKSILSNNQSGSNFSAPPRSYAEIKPANEALGDVTSSHYKKAEDLGANIHPEAAPTAAQAVRQYTEIAANDGLPLDLDLHKQTNAVLNNLAKKADSGLTVTSIENTRKRLGNIASGNLPGTPGASDGFAARQAIKGIDNLYTTMQNNPAMLESGSADAIDALKAGRTAHALESNHDTVTEIVRQANRNPNALQSKFKALFDDSDTLNKFDPEDQQAISLLAHPTALNKILKGAGQMGFGSEHPYIPTAALMSSIPTFLLNPIVAAGEMGAVATGTAANAIRAGMVRGMTDSLLKNIESKSTPVDQTLGNSGFSPLNKQQALPAPSYSNRPSASPQQMLPAPPDFTVNKVGTASPPGNTYYASPRGAQEKMAPIAGMGEPGSRGVDTRGTQMRGGSEIGQFAAQNGRQPIKPFEGATSIDQVGSKVHSPEYDQAVETLQKLARKRGGPVLTPSQVKKINKMAKKTRGGRLV